jgi:arginine N-succinyltransferase
MADRERAIAPAVCRREGLTVLVIRPVALKDLDPLMELTRSTGYGLTTLPADPAFLRKRILKSQRSFEGMADAPAGEAFLLVLEEADTGKVIGTSGMVSKVGGFEPFYAFRIETTVHESKQLAVRKEIPVLHLVAEHNGPCEIGSLFLSPASRGGHSGRILSLARFLFMADHEQCFDPVVLAEMRGVVDEQGRSAFWDAVGKHFFDIDYPRADYLSVINKRFIADLMPKHPIYITLLPPEARAVIGLVHEQTRPALRMLECEGFAWTGMVDMFDAGPIVTCPLKDIRVVRESRKVSVTEVVAGELAGEPQLVTNARTDFRACAVPVGQTPDGGARLSEASARALGVKVGDPVRFAPLRPTVAQRSSSSGTPTRSVA